MPLTVPAPIPRLGTYSPAEKRRHTDAYDAMRRRATARFVIARYAAALRAAGHSWRAIPPHVAVAIAGGLLPAGTTTPSYETVRSLVAAWESGRRSEEDYQKATRPGRTSDVDPRLRQKVAEIDRRRVGGTVRGIERALAEAAAKLRVPAPNYDQVKRLVRSRGRVARAAGSYGARAAELDAMPHATIACRHTHDIWVVDEFDAPWYDRAFDPALELWVSVRPSVIVVQEYRSGVCIGRAVSDPSRRTDPETGYIMRSGFDADDVLAALLSAACVELASAATRRFAGKLPRCIRWDNHSTHASLRPILTAFGERAKVEVGSFFPAAEDMPLGSGAPNAAEGAVARDVITLDSAAEIEVPKLPTRRPINRGKIERKIGFVKALCVGFPNHVDQVIPVDRIREDAGRQRTMAAGEGGRAPRRLPIDVMHLPEIDTSEARFDAVLDYFNTQFVSRVHGVPRSAVYHQYLPRHVRKGTDLLLALETHTAFVTRDGIEHFHGATSTEFAYEVPGKFVLPLDVAVTYKCDPLMRGIFAYVEGRHYFLPPKAVWSATPGRAQEVARQQAALARFYSDEAVSARQLVHDLQFGPGAAKAAAEAARAQVDLVAAGRADQRAVERRAAGGEPAATGTSASSRRAASGASGVSTGGSTGAPSEGAPAGAPASGGGAPVPTAGFTMRRRRVVLRPDAEQPADLDPGGSPGAPGEGAS